MTECLICVCMCLSHRCERAAGHPGPLSSSQSLVESSFLGVWSFKRPHCHEPLGCVFDTPGNKVGLSEKILVISLIVKLRGSLESMYSDCYLYEEFYGSELPVRMFKQPLGASNSTLIVITHH